MCWLSATFNYESGLKTKRRLILYCMKVKTIKLSIKQNSKPKGDLGEKNNSLYIIEQNAAVVSTGLITLAALLQCLCNWERMRWGGCAQSFSGPRGNALARYSLLNQEKHWAYPPMHELIIEPSTMFLSFSLIRELEFCLTILFTFDAKSQEILTHTINFHVTHYFTW